MEEVRNYVGKANIDGKDYFVRFTVFMQPGDNGVHSYFVTEVDVYNNTIQSASASNLLGTRLALNGITDTKLKHFFKKSREVYENFSKIVDENGEPMVVYQSPNT